MRPKPYTIALVVHPDGVWSIASHEQTPEKLGELRDEAKSRGCRLVRYPLDAWDYTRAIDFTMAEDITNV